MRLVQIIDSFGDQELWKFDPVILDEEIQKWHSEFHSDLLDAVEDKDYKLPEYESFEEWMQIHHPEVKCERLFIDEIYV